MANWRGPLYHSFRGRRYAVRRVPNANYCGHCDDPTAKQPEIIIGANQNWDALEELDSYIHEAMHACNFDLSEDAVDAIAGDISRFLRRLGYHRDK